jgi:YVTN family beta-propeller protein
MRLAMDGFLLVALLLASTVASGQESLLLVVNKSESSLSLIAPATGKELGRVGTGFAPHEVAVSADGRWAYVTDYGTGPRPGHTVTVIDIAGRRVARTLDLGRHTRPHGIVVARDGTLWVTTEGTAHVLRVDPETGEILTEAETGERVTHMVVVSPSADRVYTANIGSGTVTAVDGATGAVLAQIETGAGSEGLALTPDGWTVYASNREAGTLSEIDVETNRVIRALEVGAFPIRVEVLPDGRRALVSNAQADELAVVDLEEWRVERRIPVGAVPVGMEIAPDGKTAYVANTQADRVSVVDLTSWRVVESMVAGREPDGMAWVEGAR